MSKASKASGGNSKKKGRSNRKAERRSKGSAISLYVRGKISFEQYQKQTKG